MKKYVTMFLSLILVFLAACNSDGNKGEELLFLTLFNMGLFFICSKPPVSFYFSLFALA